MLHEYAVDPSGLDHLGPMWMLLEQFGISKGRLIAAFPDQWLPTVWRSVKEADIGDIEKKRLEERLISLQSAIVRSRREYHGKDWLEAALRSDVERPFRAIVTESPQAFENPRCLHPLHTPVRTEDWRVERGKPVLRTLEALVACVTPLVQISQDLLFIDPYCPSESGRLKLIAHVVKAAVNGNRTLRRVEVHTREQDAPLSVLAEKTQKHFAETVGIPIKVRILRWAQVHNREAFHARYVLTERGGIRVDYGLALGKRGETTDVELLDDRVWEKRWHDFQVPSPQFRLVDSTEVECCPAPRSASRPQW